MAGWIFIHLRHWAALTKPYCAYNIKLDMPVRSTLLDDFGINATDRINRNISIFEIIESQL